MQQKGSWTFPYKSGTDQACSYELQGSGQIYVLRSFSGKIKELAFRRSQLRQTPGSLTEMSTARQM